MRKTKERFLAPARSLSGGVHHVLRGGAAHLSLAKIFIDCFGAAGLSRKRKLAYVHTVELGVSLD